MDDYELLTQSVQFDRGGEAFTALFFISRIADICRLHSANNFDPSNYVLVLENNMSEPIKKEINHLHPELNPICYLPALLAHHFLHVSRIMVKSLTLRLLMSYIYIYIYMEHLFLMFLHHTQRRSTVGRTPLDE